MRLFFSFSLLALILGCGARSPSLVLEIVKTSPGADPFETILDAEERRSTNPALRELASASDASVRARATLALGRIGDPQSLNLLLKALADPNAEVQSTAAFGAGLLCPSSGPEPKRTLDKALAGESPTSTRALLLKSCARCACPSLPKALASDLEGGDGSPREAALVALGLMGDAGAQIEPFLVSSASNALLDSDAAVRLAAAFALTRTFAAEIAKAPEEVPQRLASVAANDPDPQVRYHALRALARRGNLDEKLLLEALSDPEPLVRAGAAVGLSLHAGGACDLAPKAFLFLARQAMDSPALVDETSGPGLRAALEATRACEPTAEVKKVAASLANALSAETSPPSASSALLVCLAHDLAGADDLRLIACDPQRPDTGKKLLAKRLAEGAGQDQRALKDLVQMIEDGDAGTAVAAVTALGGVQGAPARLALAETLGDERAIVATAAFEALGRRGESDLPLDEMARAIDRWRSNRTSHAVLLSAIFALSQKQSEKGSKMLADLAKDVRPEVRRAALSGLERFGQKQPLALPPLSPTHPATFEEVVRVQKEKTSARIVTTRGSLEIALWPDVAPATVASFVDLARQGFYDGTPIHRAVPGFVVQAGDPTGTGLGDPGYSLRCELSTTPFDRGVVGMALSGRDTGGSQFFLTLSRQPHLDGQYTAFGRVIDGMDIVDSIEEGDRLLSVQVVPSF
jgi:cyclophilin family peptidyl-prolyl cis-trans isomerase